MHPFLFDYVFKCFLIIGTRASKYILVSSKNYLFFARIYKLGTFNNLAGNPPKSH